MYKNLAPGGKRNLCGSQVAAIRKAKQPKVSQRALAESLQLVGIDVDKNAIQRIESGKRFVTDIELLALAQIFGVSVAQLFPKEQEACSPAWEEKPPAI